jgi:hypothetical protein
LTEWYFSDVLKTQLVLPMPRIARAEGSDGFDHGRPADVLLRKRDEILPKLSQETLTRFERLFERINSTLLEGQ